MMWEIRELPGEILDTLPCGASYISRGEDIVCWLKKHAQVNYVIIDDLNDFYTSQLDRYVETNPIVGISEADAARAIELLSSHT